MLFILVSVRAKDTFIISIKEKNESVGEIFSEVVFNRKNSYR
jgi:hypothetical protein